MWWRLPVNLLDKIKEDLEDVFIISHKDTIPLIDDEDLSAIKEENKSKE
jgi:hypothetical protein